MMNALAPLSPLDGRRNGWYLTVFALAVLGWLGSVALVFSTPSDPWSVRWDLLLVPIVVTALPLASRARTVRMVCAAILGIWCVIASASVGVLFVPALIVMIAALVRGGEDS